MVEITCKNYEKHYGKNYVRYMSFLRHQQSNKIL